jgi:hypothetical protein
VDNLKEKDIAIEQGKTSPKNSATEYFWNRKPARKSIAIDQYRAILKSYFAYCCKDIDELMPADVQAWLDANYGKRTREFQADKQPTIEKE